jgi:hypothetical protein
MRGSRLELSTVGFDENLQNVGSDPYRSPYWVGQRIPSAPPQNGSRYLFLLAIKRIDAHRKIRLVGMRQLVTIGQYVQVVVDEQVVASYPIELEVTSPYFKFPDANISWHLRRVPPMYQNVTANTNNCESRQFRYGQSPALLFENPTTDAGEYLPPYGGQPPGNILVPDLATFHDLRFPWRNSQVWQELDVEIEGPCDVALFASVKQTDPNSRTPLIVPPGVPLETLSREDAFIAKPLNNADPKQQVGMAPNAVYWRIAGSLIFEEENFYPTPREMTEPMPRTRCLDDGNGYDGGGDYGGSDDGGGDRQGSHGGEGGSDSGAGGSRGGSDTGGSRTKRGRGKRGAR